jgi:hypothetical protein
MRVTDFASVMGHDRRHSTIKVLLKSMKLIRMVDIARMNDVQHVEVCGKCFCKSDGDGSSMGGFGRTIGRVENSTNIQCPCMEYVYIRTDGERRSRGTTKDFFRGGAENKSVD